MIQIKYIIVYRTMLSMFYSYEMFYTAIAVCIIVFCIATEKPVPKYVPEPEPIVEPEPAERTFEFGATFEELSAYSGSCTNGTGTC